MSGDTNSINTQRERAREGKCEEVTPVSQKK